MPFPAQVTSLDERGLFLVQDTRLRSSILPLFSFDPRQTEERPEGQGTAFRIDPWGGCATAFHVIEDLLVLAGNRAVLRDNIRLAALELEGVPLGAAPIPPDAWRAFEGMFSIMAVHSPPIGPANIRNATELAAIQISRSSNAVGPPSFLPVDVRRWRPAIGERIMALGFAELDVDPKKGGDRRPISQYLYGSVATITQIQAADGASSRPWPIFRVEANWPGAMSGGPVFNQAGHVIGLVSTGLVGGDVGTATFFSGWNMAEKTYPKLDPSNPGWLRGWLAIDSSDNVIAFAPSNEALLSALANRPVAWLGAGTLDPIGGGYGRS